MKDFYITQIATVKTGFKDLFKRGKYEEVVLDVLNKSKIIFKFKFKQIQEQAHGEPDFVDENNNKYEVKLLIDDSQGKAIGDKKSKDLINWFERIKNEIEEIGPLKIRESIKNNKQSPIANSTLYKIMIKDLLNIKEDETAILFIPYPIVFDDENDNSITKMVSDDLDSVYKEIAKQENIKNKGTFYIYPSANTGRTVIRNANTKEREYVESTEMNKYIMYETTLRKK